MCAYQIDLFTTSLFGSIVQVHSAAPLAQVPGAVGAVAAVAGGGGRRVLVATQQGGIYK